MPFAFIRRKLSAGALLQDAFMYPHINTGMSLPDTTTFLAHVFSCEAASPTHNERRVLLCSCTSVAELLDVLHHKVGKERLTATEDTEENNFFLWVDVHGVPPPSSSLGSTLTELWRFFDLADAQVAQLDGVAAVFAPSPTAAARTEDAASSDTHEPFTEAETPVPVQALSLSDLYLEDPRAVAPESVAVRPLTDKESKDNTRIRCCVMSELSVLLETGEDGGDTKGWKTVHRAPRYPHGASTDWFAIDTEGCDREMGSLAETSEVLDGLAMNSRKASPPEVLLLSREEVDLSVDELVVKAAIDDAELPEVARTTRRLELYDDEVASDASRSADSHLPVITSTYLVAFPNVCLTWCPASTYGQHHHHHHYHQPQRHQQQGEEAEGHDEPVRTRCVKDWHRLQEAVVARMRGGSTHVLHSSSGVPTTAQFASLLLATVCYAYLPDTTAVLNEVDAIDAMLPLIVPDRESDQADALRRVLVLRRRLAVHRRLLYQKMRLLEELQRPAMRTIVGFMTRDKETRDAPFKSIQEIIRQALTTLDGARVSLGNATLVYTSTVTFRNSQTSTRTDYFQLSILYMLMVLLPLNIVATHWGMNCFVPWFGLETVTPFWGIVGFMGFVALCGLAIPIYAYQTGRMNMIM